MAAAAHHTPADGESHPRQPLISRQPHFALPRLDARCAHELRTRRQPCALSRWRNSVAVCSRVRPSDACLRSWCRSQAQRPPFRNSPANQTANNPAALTTARDKAHASPYWARQLIDRRHEFGTIGTAAVASIPRYPLFLPRPNQKAPPHSAQQSKAASKHRAPASPRGAGPQPPTQLDGLRPYPLSIVRGPEQPGLAVVGPGQAGRRWQCTLAARQHCTHARHGPFSLPAQHVPARHDAVRPSSIIIRPLVPSFAISTARELQ